MGPRLAFAAGAAIVVVLAVVLTVLVLFQDEGKERRVASTVTSAPAAQQVSTNDAVAGIMPMYKHLKSYDLRSADERRDSCRSGRGHGSDPPRGSLR